MPHTLARAPSWFFGALALLVLTSCGDALSDTRDVPAQIPWKGAGVETYHYQVRDRDGATQITASLTVEEAGAETRFLQRYESPDGTDEVTVVADAITLRPKEMTRSIRSTSVTRDIHAIYGTDTVKITITGDDPQVKDLEFPPHAYDTEESLFLWRTLPFTVGHDVRYVAINPNRPTGRVGNAHVIAIEQVTVPAGTFEVWRVEATAAGSRVVAWYETAAPYRLIRYDAGDFLYELVDGPG